MSAATIAVSGTTAQADGDIIQSVALNRYKSAADLITDVATNHPDGQFLDKSLGHIWPKQVTGTRALYQCYIRYARTAGAVEFFTSIDPKCEAGTGEVTWQTPVRLSTIGYVNATPIDGLVPLYRCRATTGIEIFDTLDSKCEGGTLQGRLGYVAPNPFIVG